MKKQNHILLLTAGVNNDKNSSWLVYSKFVKLMRAQYDASIEIICFTPSIKSSKKLLGEKTQTTFLRDKLLSAILNRVSRNYTWFVACLYAKIYSKKVIEEIKEKKINRLWVHTDLLTMLVLEKILQQIKIPFHLTIYDDPFTNKNYQPFQVKVDALLKNLFEKAKSIDTPTLLLANYYRSKGYIQSSCQVSESLVGTFKEQIKKPKINDNVKRIALAGSIYGLDALNSFFAIIGNQLKINGIEFHLRTNVPKVYMRYIENNYPAIAKYIIIKPFVAEPELSTILQEYDLLYLPMMFSENYRFKTDTSFPSKTHNYLASGIPIIVHTPRSSSLYQFFDENNIGHLISSMDSESIKLSFEQILIKDHRDKLSNDIQDFNDRNLKNEHVKSLYNIICS